MRMAILYKNNEIYVEFGPEKFKPLLKEYIKKYGDSDKAIDKMEEELKKETLYV